MLISEIELRSLVAVTMEQAYDVVYDFLNRNDRRHLMRPNSL